MVIYAGKPRVLFLFLMGIIMSIQKHVDLAQVMAKLVVNMTIKTYHIGHWSQFSKWDVTFWNGDVPNYIKTRSVWNKAQL